MSYDSDVAIMTTEDGEKALRRAADAALARTGKDDGRPWLSADPGKEKCSPEVVRCEGGCVMLLWEEVSFYEDYPETVALRKAIDEVRRSGVPIEFCRVGEGFGDGEQGGWDERLPMHIELKTSINVFNA